MKFFTFRTVGVLRSYKLTFGKHLRKTIRKKQIADTVFPPIGGVNVTL